MPALRRLREIAETQAHGAAQQETLTFWTARGLLQLTCRVEAAKVQGVAAAVSVQALEAVPATGAKVPTARRNRRGPDLDVALDAWLAHELRTPLERRHRLCRDPQGRALRPARLPRYSSYARDIYDSARHALGVLDSMLRGDRARSALPSLAFADVDPAGVVESCLTVARPLAEQAGLSSAELPPPAAHRRRRAEAQADAAQSAGQRHQVRASGDRVTVAVAYDVDGPLPSRWPIRAPA